jgi:hypothetical protein
VFRLAIGVDGGKTWDPLKHQLFGYYALGRPFVVFMTKMIELMFRVLGLDVVSTSVAYAAVDNLLTQTSGVAKYTL